MNDRFPSTRHSLMFAVKQPELRDEALAAIAEIYWKPAYKYIRLRWNKSVEDAQDLTQSFFAEALLDRDLIALWDPARASFRTFLRLSLDAHVKNDLTAASRQKRGGGLLMDFNGAELEIANPGTVSPEDLFHREWQRRMFELAIEDLRTFCVERGFGVRFRIFEQYDLADEPRPAYADLAAEHGIPLTTVTNHLSWSRRELRRLMEERLLRATSGDEEARREVRALFGAAS
jgi:DNA-directed RNA polymerase specialized sigma24 family protein